MFVDAGGLTLHLNQGETGFVIHHVQDGGKLEPVREGDGVLSPREFEAIAERLAKEILASRPKSSSDKGNGLISRSMIGMAQQLVAASEAIQARKAARILPKLVRTKSQAVPVPSVPPAPSVMQFVPKVVITKSAVRKKRKPRKPRHKGGRRVGRRDGHYGK
jgi:hypothetical protein